MTTNTPIASATPRRLSKRNPSLPPSKTRARGVTARKLSVKNSIVSAITPELHAESHVNVRIVLTVCVLTTR